ncbi:ethylene-responsive transcription factor ERF018-like [Punica granatum]|uniref:AP2/ERF domain-containing protein n=2 Tax=Punica granatum TaxID=22663 RepID=A0A218XH97_PUNGR|nr:ethylene-responsive transcription factor ERF018-like [Punica granatum]OWM84059.1 hypothetical protein CDL15_Pgr009306 [Punica granatum]PKI76048.1 hypothetical protein CRG98_003598 [Punica granatum]
MVKRAIGKLLSQSSEERRDTDFKYKGVRKRKWGKWVSEIRLPNSRDRIWLGSYDSADQAARAFDAAQVCLRGPSARLNFPGSSPAIPSGPLTHEEIQSIAARFANSGIPAEPPMPEASLGSVSEESSEESRAQSESGQIFPDSPSDSISIGSSQVDSTGRSFMDFLVDLDRGSESYKPLDYGIFPGFDDFTDDYYTQTIPITEFGEEKFDDFSGQEFFLWDY